MLAQHRVLSPTLVARAMMDTWGAGAAGCVWMIWVGIAGVAVEVGGVPLARGARSSPKKIWTKPWTTTGMLYPPPARSPRRLLYLPRFNFSIASCRCQVRVHACGAVSDNVSKRVESNVRMTKTIRRRIRSPKKRRQKRVKARRATLRRQRRNKADGGFESTGSAVGSECRHGTGTGMRGEMLETGDECIVPHHRQGCNGGSAGACAECGRATQGTLHAARQACNAQEVGGMEVPCALHGTSQSNSFGVASYVQWCGMLTVDTVAHMSRAKQ